MPIIDHYKGLSLVSEMNGEQSPDEVSWHFGANWFVLSKLLMSKIEILVKHLIGKNLNFNSMIGLFEYNSIT